MNKVLLGNLDTHACKSTLLRLSFYSSNVLQDVFASDTTQDSINIEIDSMGNVTLVDSDQNPISETDAIISYDDSTGTYEIDLVSPLISMDLLDKVGLESRNL